MLQQSVKLTPQVFTQTFLPFAKQSESDTGISAVAILAQAALESGWNSATPGWAFFGIKDTDGINGNEQLLPTFEYNKSSTLTPKGIGLNSITSITPTLIHGVKFFKYAGMGYFRKYNNPAESFTDHAKFFLKNPRYKNAVAVGANADAFFDALQKAGYAQSPSYAALLKKVADMITAFL